MVLLSHSQPKPPREGLGKKDENRNRKNSNLIVGKRLTSVSHEMDQVKPITYKRKGHCLDCSTRAVDCVVDRNSSDELSKCSTASRNSTENLRCTDRPEQPPRSSRQVWPTGQLLEPHRLAPHQLSGTGKTFHRGGAAAPIRAKWNFDRSAIVIAAPIRKKVSRQSSLSLVVCSGDCETPTSIEQRR